MLQYSTNPEPGKSSSRPTSPYLFQRIGNIDLVNNLVFNREKVYQSLRKSSPIRTSTPKKEEESTRIQSIEEKGCYRVIPSIEEQKEGDAVEAEPILSYLNSTKMVVKKLKGRTAKKAPAKAKPKEKMVVMTTRKRSLLVANIERASKIQKSLPRANSGKRVNGRGSSATDAFVISDDEEVGERRRESRTDSLTPPRQMLKIDSPDSEADLNATPSYSNKLESELVHVNAVHAKEIEQLHQQLNAAEVKVKQVKQEAEQRIFELQRQQIITSDRQMADLQECLEVERRQSSGLSWECDYLRREIEAARSCLKGESNLIREHDEYIQSHKEEQEVNANLIRSLRKKDEESVRKADEEAKDMQRLVKDMEELQREFTQLKDEFAPLKSFSLSQTAESRSNASSTPSQSPSTSYAEQRLANMRKTYITVKRRYDRLHAVAMNISTTTRSWDYGSFGEHGQYLRQLKTALDDNGQEEQAVGLNSPVAKVE